MGVRIGHVELNVPPAVQDGVSTRSASLQLLPHLPALNQKLTQHLRDGDHDRYIRLQWNLAALPYHTLVASNSQLFRGEDGRLGIFLLLPSNPEVKDASKLVFGNPHVHAQRFLREQFKHLLAMSYWITKVLVNALPG